MRIGIIIVKGQTGIVFARKDSNNLLLISILIKLVILMKSLLILSLSLKTWRKMNGKYTMMKILLGSLRLELIILILELFRWLVNKPLKARKSSSILLLITKLEERDMIWKSRLFIRPLIVMEILKRLFYPFWLTSNQEGYNHYYYH